jgi:hypothetical protein
LDGENVSDTSQSPGQQKPKRQYRHNKKPVIKPATNRRGKKSEKKVVTEMKRKKTLLVCIGTISLVLSLSIILERPIELVDITGLGIFTVLTILTLVPAIIIGSHEVSSSASLLESVLSTSSRVFFLFVLFREHRFS